MHWQEKAENIVLPEWYKREGWNSQKAVEEQRVIARRAEIKRFDGRVQRIAAFDVSFWRGVARGIGLVFDVEWFEPVEIKRVVLQESELVPYQTTFLSYREVPVILKLIIQLNNDWDIALIDGQGLMHPRFCGIATHLGVLLDMPTIGCAKSYLFGTYEEPANKRFAFSYVFSGEKKIGAVLRTRENVKPVFVSPGTLVDIDSAIEIVKMVTGKYRIPEPLRLAHIYSKGREK